MTTSSTPSGRPASLASIRIITADVQRLAAFYETVSGAAVRWSTPDFGEIVTPAGTLALGSTRTVGLFTPGAAGGSAPDPIDIVAGENRSVIIEFLVDDVDTAFTRLAGEGLTFVTEPTTMPWGNRSLLLRDPDGNLVNLFTPVTAAARARFAR